MADEKKETTPAATAATAAETPAVSQGKASEPRASVSVETVPARTTGSANGAQGGFFDSGMPMIFAGGLLLMYFMILRPEKKRREAQMATLSAIKKDDKVVLTTGIYGTVASTEGDDVVLIIDTKKDVRIKVRKDAIGSTVGPEVKK